MTLKSIFMLLVSALLPLVILMVSVRAVMSETFLRWEYQRAGFPEDRYGWDTSVRLEYGPYGIRYLLQDKDISYLADLRIDGEPAFRQKELDHMEDVHVVTRGIFTVLNAATVVFALALAGVGWRRSSWADVWRALLRGGIFSLGVMGGLLIVAVVAWDFFFETFHQLFFEDGTWQFYRNDTLIRLYPPQFWFDAALAVGLLTLGGALAFVGGPWLALNRTRQQPDPPPHTVSEAL
ncbi:MAG: TIGR01906 family membrane protein [Anaerolineales bacterium]